MQTNTNNVNKTQALLETTEDRRTEHRFSAHIETDITTRN